MKDLWTIGLLMVLVVGSGVTTNNKEGVKTKNVRTPLSVSTDTTVAEKVLSHSVRIMYKTAEDEMAMGSGVLYKKNGKCYVMTAAHVVRDETSYGCGKIIVAFTSIESDTPTHAWMGSLVEHNAPLDVAIIELKGANPKDVADTVFAKETPRVGRDVYAVGNPAGSINTVTEGIVCHNHRKIDWCEQRHIEVTCNGAPGLSGGGVFTMDKGECIGLVVRLNMSSRILIVVPIKEIMDWMSSNNISQKPN